MKSLAKRTEFFNGVYDILVDFGKANPSMRSAFIHAHVNSSYPCAEWRFEGLLGYGGKYRGFKNTVDCYKEDENPKRVKIIDQINSALKSLKLKMKPIVYVDMDGVLANYDAKRTESGEGAEKEAGFFLSLEPMQDAIRAFKQLHEMGCNVYILSTAPWSNPNAWIEKRLWVEQHLGEDAFKRLILSHNKGLLKGDYLIDDRIANGVDQFEGKHIHFGSKEFPEWASVIAELKYTFDNE